MDCWTDAELMRKVAERDMQAREALVVGHYPSVLRYLRWMLGSSINAEDIAQSTFMAAISHAATFRGESSVRAWLMTIARNEAHAYRRKSAPADARTVEELGLAAGWGALAPKEDPREQFERTNIVRTALSQLAHDDTEILVLRDVEGFSGEETAATLGLTLAAMKSRLHRARLALAAAIHSGGSDAE